MKRILLISVLLVWVFSFAEAQPLPRATPESAGMDSRGLAYADSAIMRSIESGETPGAVLGVVRFGKLVYLKAYGDKQTHPQPVPMTENTVFDMASVSKSVSTAVSAMILIERGLLRLYDNVSLFIPGFQPWTDSATGWKTEIKVIHLMTHTSGLPAYASVEELQKQYATPNPDGLIEHISNVNRLSAPRAEFRYSCLNFITLQRIIEIVSGKSLQAFARENIFQPLGMIHTDYNPLGETLNRSAPTEPDRVPTGTVHDPLARVMNGGVSGNAGVFSDAEDLAVLSAMLLNDGELNGIRVLSPPAVKAMRTVPEGYEEFGRTLGWDLNSAYSSNKGDLLGSSTYGHTGFTGTALVIDPEMQTAVILLTNSVHLKTGNVIRLRGLVSNAVAGAIRQMSE